MWSYGTLRRSDTGKPDPLSLTRCYSSREEDEEEGDRGRLLVCEKGSLSPRVGCVESISGR